MHWSGFDRRCSPAPFQVTTACVTDGRNTRRCAGFL